MNQYTEFKKTIDNFMVNTGIREYCTTICKGICCNGCTLCFAPKDNKPTMESIACEVFICSPLCSLLFNREEVNFYNNFLNLLQKEIGKLQGYPHQYYERIESTVKLLDKQTVKFKNALKSYEAFVTNRELFNKIANKMYSISVLSEDAIRRNAYENKEQIIKNSKKK